MHLFAIAARSGRVEEHEWRALAGADPRPEAVARAASGRCLLGLRGSGPFQPLSLASAGTSHAVVAGDILQPLEEEIDFASAQPAALLLRRFQRHGLESLGRINGLFCAVIWEDAERRMTAVCDRVGGFQPLYYASRGTRLAISSSLPALLALPWMSRAMDPVALHELFATGYVLPPATLIRDIGKLGPGEALVFEEGGLAVRLLERAAPRPSEGAVRLSPEALEERLTRSLARTASRGGRRAYLLSGGIDSSTLLTLAARADPEPLRAFTGSFAGTAMDESAYARLLAERLGCAHVQVDLTSPALLDSLPLVVWHLGEPTHDFSVIPTFHLLRRVAEEADTIVSGDGPDHLFCRYYPLAAKRLVAPLARHLPPVTGSLAALPGFSLLEKLRRAAAPDLLTAYRDLFLGPAWGIDGGRRLRALLRGGSPPPPSASGYLAERRFLRRHRLADLLADLTYIDLHVDGSFGVFHKVGAMACANGLVPREPFLDRDVADSILSLPHDQWVRGSFVRLLASQGAGKHLLKHELGARLLPGELLGKPKHGFTPPLAAWLRERLCRTPVRQWLCPPLCSGDLLDVSVVQRIADEHCARVWDWSLVLFLLLSLDVWMRMVLLEPEAHEPEWTLRDTGFGE